ncbi:MAG: hypothetical protein WAL82_03515 [Candidatus Acidiferrales bacterium]
MWAIINGLVSQKFNTRSFGLGERTNPTPKWLGRVWFICLGLWFMVMAWGRVPLLVPRIISVGLGVLVLVYTSGFIFSRHVIEPTNQGVFSSPDRGAFEKFRIPLGIFIGLFLIVGGLLLK